MVKKCTMCKEVRDISFFIKRSDWRMKKEGPGQYRCYCTDCIVTYNKSRRVTNPVLREKAKARTKSWCLKYPDKAKNSRLFKVFGITLEERDQMLADQGGKCANPLCDATHPGFYKSKARLGTPRDWHVDHCHQTGVIRGILCYSCNTALGLARESIPRLTGLIEYLKIHHPEKTQE